MGEQDVEKLYNLRRFTLNTNQVIFEREIKIVNVLYRVSMLNLLKSIFQKQFVMTRKKE